MKHLKKGRKFGRKAGLRKSMMKALLNSFVIKEKIKTTEAKAKEMRPVIEKIITRAKKDTVANRRLAAKSLCPEQVKKLFKDIAPAYSNRKGGYTRIIKMGRRKIGDAGQMAIIELVK